MKKRFIVFYTIFASLFILFSLSYMGTKLYKEYNEGTSRSSSIFANTVFKLYSVLPELENDNAQNYNNLLKTTGNVNDFSFYQISTEGKVIFTYPTGSNTKDSQSNFTKNFTTTIQLDNKKTYEVESNIFLLKPYSIYYYSRLTFFLILGLTILTIILILISNKKDKIIETANAETTNDTQTNINDDEKVVNNPTDIEFKIDSHSEELLSDSLQESQIINDNQEETIIENSDEKQDTPEGLFSDSSGLGWESYLLTRLENEINRAISTEMDISLFIIKLTDIKRTSELNKSICDYLAEQFKFRDLLFEYKDDCIVAIQTGANIDEALSLGEKIHNDIINIISTENNQCFIGISSRSVRMISAEQFLKEANEALIHAQQDKESPIIAFRADIDKYRKYMEQKYDN